MGQIERLLSADVRIGQGLAAIELRAVRCQRLLGLLESLKYGGVETRERGRCIGLGLGHARPRQGLVRETPADAGADAPGTRVGPGELVELCAHPAVEAGGTDARVQVRASNADARCGGSDPPVVLA